MYQKLMHEHAHFEHVCDICKGICISEKNSEKEWINYTKNVHVI